MSQYDVDLSADPSGDELLDIMMTNIRENAITSNSGIARPPYAVEGTVWLDTSVEPWPYKMYTGSTDIIIGYFDKTNRKFIPITSMTTTGDLPTIDGNGNLSRIPATTAGKVLTSNGIGQLPTYQTFDYADKSLSNLTDAGMDLLEQTVSMKIADVSYVGDLKPCLRNTNHGNWLLCNGQSVSRTTYSELFSVIGTGFGAVDSITFKLPDYRGKFLRGLGGNSANSMYTSQAEGLPNIKGGFTSNRFGWGGAVGTGAFKGSNTQWNNGSDYGSNGYNVRFDFDASTYDSIYGASAHVTPENYAVNWFIKAKDD